MGASYNTGTKQIMVSKPKNLFKICKWQRSMRHELRHNWQDKHGILDLASWMYFFCIPLTLMLILLYPQYYLLDMLPAGVHYALTMAIEVDAWIYAIFN